MEETPSEIHDFLSIFKSKIEEAISIVGLIPEEQREEVWKFWDLVTDTVKIYTSFCLHNAEKANTEEVPAVEERTLLEPAISVPSSEENTEESSSKTVERIPQKGSVHSKFKRRTLHSSQGRGIKREQRIRRKPRKYLLEKEQKDKTKTESSTSEEVTASVIALNDATLNESNVVYLDNISTLDLSDLIQFPSSTTNEEQTQDIYVHAQVPSILDAVSSPPSVVSQCEVSIPAKKGRKIAPCARKRKGKRKRNGSDVGKNITGTDTMQTDKSSEAKNIDTNINSVSESYEAVINIPQTDDAVQPTENLQALENDNEKGKSDSQEKKIRKSNRKPKPKFRYAEDGTIDYTHGIPPEILDEDDCDDRCDIGMDHAYDEDFKSIMGGKRRRRLKKMKFPRVPPDLTCKECGVTLSNTGALNVHMRKHTGSRPFFCEKCGKTFTTKANMQRHVKSHTGEKPFPCEVCKKSFTEKKSLVTHMRLHTGEKPYSCTVCGKSFTQSATLAAHMNIHTGEKAHLCELCGRKFNQKPNLVTHMRRHENNRRFKCGECNYFFITKGELERHLLKHTGERPFLCTLCPKGFTRLQYLTEHMNQHTGNKPYSCVKCSSKFHDLSAYHRHAKKHSKEDKTKESEKENQEQHEKTEENFKGEKDSEKTDTHHVVLATNGILQYDALQQIQDTINQQVVKMKQMCDEGEQMEQEFQTVIIKGTAEQQAQAIEALQQQLAGFTSAAPDSEGTLTTVTNIMTAVGDEKDSATVTNNDTQEVYQIWLDPSSNEVMATVDFSAFNLLASATANAKQFTTSNSK